MSRPVLPLSLSKAIEVKVIDSNRYEGEVSADFCYASAHTKPTAHGGYVASIILKAVQQHFATTHAGLNLPDTFTSHFRFLDASNAGPIVIEIDDVKIGKNSSTVHFSAKQEGRENIVGYATNFNAAARQGTGFTVPMPSLLVPAPPPIDFQKLAEGTDPNWICHTEPYRSNHKIKSQTQSKYALPRHGMPSSTVSDGWISPIQPGERYTNLSLGWMADQWPQGVPDYRPVAVPSEGKNPYGLMNTARGIWGAPMWYPTLTMDVELKKSLPTEGVEWLFVRSKARMIKDGRMDLEVMVFDMEMDLVALSHHVCFVISLAPKVKKRVQKTKL